MTNDKPVVSVIIPCFNVEGHIEQAIRSALDQTLGNLEVIIVDDCSTDGTADILSKFGDPRVRILRNPTNQGAAFSRNRALQVARGEWIAVLDGDDWWERTRLERLIGVAKKSGSDAVCDDLFLVREGNPIRETLLHRAKLRQREPWKLNPQILIEKRLSALQPVFSKQFTLKHGLAYKDELRYGEDLAFLLELICLGASVLVYPAPLYYYRQWSSSLTSQKRRLYAGMAVTLQTLVKSYEDNPTVNSSLLRRLKQNADQLLIHTWLEQMRSQGKAGAAIELLRQPRIFFIMLSMLPRSLLRRVRSRSRRLLRRG